MSKATYDRSAIRRELRDYLARLLTRIGPTPRPEVLRYVAALARFADVPRA